MGLLAFALAYWSGGRLVDELVGRRVRTLLKWRREKEDFEVGFVRSG